MKHDRQISLSLDVANLIYRHFTEGLTEMEQEALDAWLNESPLHQKLFDELANTERRKKYVNELLSNDIQNGRAAIQHKINKRHHRKKLNRWLAAAAMIVLFPAAALIWSSAVKYNVIVDKKGIVTSVRDVKPGGSKAILTLANGSKIALDSTHSRHSFKLKSGKLIQISNGILSYQGMPLENSAPENIHYNILSTPKGGQYKLILPDGTEVWLNSYSSIRFPTSFTANYREVEISGEAYFKVARRERQPFIVNVRGLQVKDLGTIFNISAYEDEPVIKTTLVEGAVRVKSQSRSGVIKRPITLHPGEQLQVYSGGEVRVNDHADINKATAWKEGFFVFHGDDLASIMREIARWYDVQIVYDHQHIPQAHVTGSIQRKFPLSKVLQMLNLAEGATFEIRNNEIIVKPFVKK